MMKIVIATLSTSNFDFLACGTDEDHARRIMRSAWNEHRRQTGATDRWDDVAEDVNYQRVNTGMATRNFSPIVQAVA